MIDIRQVESLEELEQIRVLWRLYWTDLGFTPCFQDFGTELATLPGRYAPPDGRLLIAYVDGQPAGAGAYRKLDDTTCEAKRLYVKNDARGQGIGELLMRRLIAEACAAGFERLVGDTLPVMDRALALYDRMGFGRLESYPGSTPGAICIEYKLGT